MLAGWLRDGLDEGLHDAVQRSNMLFNVLTYLCIFEVVCA
jgi:hypothetical protein